MREYFLTLLIAAVLTYMFTPLVRSLALRSSAVASVRERDIHTQVTPRWGGVAMWLAMGATLVMVSSLNLVGKAYSQELLGIFLAASFVLLIGALDDRYELDAVVKLAGQGLAAAILLIFGIQILWLPIDGIIVLPTNIGQLLTVVVVVVIINAVNFIDGLDGLATGIVGISAAAFFGFSYLLAVENGFSRAGAPSLVTAIVIGCCLGFLPHNAHPAKIFMGDSGSMFLGLLLAASAITLMGQIDANAVFAEKIGPAALPLLLPFAVLAIPLLDLALAVLRRVRSGRSPFAPDQEHLHHKLMAWGNSQQRSAVILYLVTAMLALPAMLSAFIPLWAALLVGVLLLLSAVLTTKREKKVKA
ncbi:MAG: undecaprenyl/decaprenyl-phosphate alpha-N-acetylglucosaminyl 1-phosphate transferase [Candidatus Nanopelagicales bacterium]|jgi:UDP-GlcNAc:undecaprenyl-phosphate/decaprenyl-phosphate GlcNAc-1-phosphate transferase|uniref:UDP-N-acetylmuramyl pentapeptide phosphotransferase n=1 Tax=Actinobacteria bacterium BACL2 MAG-120813-bin23 TaxID=1655569 RepID=A0A0R2Q4L3_9ACTN|nr:MAG: UDP-N-acetylmuramyl pentapeptide phosphotransferase [Actinobacteria bacterium BACL2 MAG-120813-bin23]MDP4614990.1 undecaprenyl/decaprenyl-phosphate alpha-N-acetylglucosaminyl 1-phosphate transferase [Candidatus Nanopelagicales bacterium]MDP4864761.1 undecaprenyl/decaprenyl-phosphate alpha-N-acetylglucosaminyl 1-phosphate transferase [Candidatus Nanopelagicaceae bacterium]MDP4653377.1 undecaprenyl/decaprenyl-phosphate alpha-N-acetylglucosaminyl 1-phosphate transferase [Candidatus Nanopela